MSKFAVNHDGGFGRESPNRNDHVVLFGLTPDGLAKRVDLGFPDRSNTPKKTGNTIGPTEQSEPRRI